MNRNCPVCVLEKRGKMYNTQEFTEEELCDDHLAMRRAVWTEWKAARKRLDWAEADRLVSREVRQ
jgi:hypothetical protein